MTPANDHFHVHTCTLCGEWEACRDDCGVTPRIAFTHEDGHAIMFAADRTCSTCNTGIDAVDALEQPTRGELSGVALIRVVARGTRAALGKRATRPEDAPAELERHVAPLGPVDPTRPEPDTWYRMGAVLGAMDAWTGRAFRIPPDCPRGEPMMAYTAAWFAAAGVVNQIRSEVDHG